MLRVAPVKPAWKMSAVGLFGELDVLEEGRGALGDHGTDLCRNVPSNNYRKAERDD